MTSFRYAIENVSLVMMTHIYLIYHFADANGTFAEEARIIIIKDSNN